MKHPTSLLAVRGDEHAICRGNTPAFEDLNPSQFPCQVLCESHEKKYDIKMKIGVDKYLIHLYHKAASPPRMVQVAVGR